MEDVHILCAASDFSSGNVYGPPREVIIAKAQTTTVFSNPLLSFKTCQYSQLQSTAADINLYAFLFFNLSRRDENACLRASHFYM